MSLEIKVSLMILLGDFTQLMLDLRIYNTNSQFLCLFSRLFSVNMLICLEVIKV
jgi:hypothetical protein